MERFYARTLTLRKTFPGKEHHLYSTWGDFTCRNKSLFILTFANKVKEEHFTTLMHQWENAGRKWLIKIIDPGIAEKIPIVPAGRKNFDLP